MADTLKFGPEWLRALSGGNSVTSPPPSPGVMTNKYKLAEYRYGREEMLALFVSSEVPESLKQHPALCLEKTLHPLAFAPLTDEEQRLMSGCVNSGAVMRTLGRGSSGPPMRGRGGGMDRGRGRGRGRGDGGYFQRGSSFDEEGSYGRGRYTRSDSWEDGVPDYRTNGSENRRNALEFGREKRPFDRGGSNFGSRAYDDDPDSPRRQFSRSMSTENWREAKKEDDGDGGDWRRAGPRDKWSSRSNWRDHTDYRDRGRYDDYHHMEKPFDRGERYQRSKSGSWDNDYEGETLPEWSNTDVEDMDNLGTFDSSGAFMSLKELEEAEEKEKKKKAEEKDKKKRPGAKKDEDWAEEVRQAEENGKGEKDKNEGADKDKRVQSVEKNGGEAKRVSPSASAQASKEEERATNEAKPKKVAASATGRAAEAKPQESAARKKTQKQEAQVKSDSSVKNGVNSINNSDESKSIAPTPAVKTPSSGKETPEEGQQSSSSGGGQGDPESAKPRSMMGAVKSDSVEEEAFDHLKEAAENLVAAWSAEEDAKSEIISQVEEGAVPLSHEDSKKWFYRDPQGDLQGPFTAAEMAEWFSAGYFTMNLQIKRGCDETFSPLGDEIKRYNRVPFLPGHSPPPRKKLQDGNAAISNSMPAGGDAGVPNVAQKVDFQQAAAYQQQFLLQQQFLQQKVMIRQMQLLQALQREPQWKNTPVQHLQMLASQLAMKELAMEMQATPQQQQQAMAAAASLQQQQELAAKASLAGEQPPSSAASQFQRPVAQQGNWNQEQQPVSSAGPSVWDIPAKPQQPSMEEIQRLQQIEAERQQQQKREAEEQERKLVEAELRKQREKEEERRREERRREEDMKKQAEAAAAAAAAAEVERLQEKERIRIEKLKREQEELMRKREEEEQRRAKEEQKRQDEILRRQQDEEERKRRAADELERRRGEELARRAEKAEEARRIQQMQQIEMMKQMKQAKLSNMQLPSSAQWGANTPPSNNSAAPSLNEILQMEQQNAKLEQEKKQREMDVQKQHVAALQQVQQQQQQKLKSWGQARPAQTPQGPSLLEIQNEQARHMEKERQMWEQSKPAVSLGCAVAWGSAGNALNSATWAADGAWGKQSKPAAGFWEAAETQSNKKPQNNKQLNANFPQLGKANTQPVQSSKVSKTSKSKKDEEAVQRLFDAMKPKDEFTLWCEQALKTMNSQVDIPTFVTFLKDVDSPYEVYDYVKNYIGESPEAREFAKQFLSKRSKYQCSSPYQVEESSIWGDNVTASATESEEQRVSKKKKKKMQKLDVGSLGFTVHAAPDRLVGEIDSLDG